MKSDPILPFVSVDTIVGIRTEPKPWTSHVKNSALPCKTCSFVLKTFPFVLMQKVSISTFPMLQDTVCSIILCSLLSSSHLRLVPKHERFFSVFAAPSVKVSVQMADLTEEVSAAQVCHKSDIAAAANGLQHIAEDSCYFVCKGSDCRSDRDGSHLRYNVKAGTMMTPRY